MHAAQEHLVAFCLRVAPVAIARVVRGCDNTQYAAMGQVQDTRAFVTCLDSCNLDASYFSEADLFHNTFCRESYSVLISGN